MKDKGKITVVRFIQAINNHNVDRLVRLITKDHQFFDSTGVRVANGDEVREAWGTYFAMFPDYHIAVVNILQEGDLVAVFGTFRGTLAVNGQLSQENKWEMPASWKATIRNNRVASWQVYADNLPVHLVMERNQVT